MPIQTPSRSREINPDFFMNETLAECSFGARLLLPGLWTMADREGRLEDRPKQIDAKVFPYDDADVSKLMGELVARGFIDRYQAAGLKVIEIANWRRWQSPHAAQDAIYPDRDGNIPPNRPKGSQFRPRDNRPTDEGLPV